MANSWNELVNAAHDRRQAITDRITAEATAAAEKQEAEALDAEASTTDKEESQE